MRANHINRFAFASFEMTLVEVIDVISHKISKIVHLKDNETKVDETKLYSYSSAREYMKSFDYRMGFEWLPEDYENITNFEMVYFLSKPIEEDLNKENVKLELKKLDEEVKEKENRYNEEHRESRIANFYQDYIQKNITENQNLEYSYLIQKNMNNKNIKVMRFLCEEIVRERKGKEVEDKYLELERKANIYFNKKWL